MSRIGEQTFLFVTGKGGVGKSTVAAALSVHLARRGRKTLLTSSSGNPQIGRLFGAAVDTIPRAVAPNLFLSLIDPDEAMREYVEDAMGSRLLARALFHQKVARGFLAGIPGLRAWALLGKAWYQSTTDVPGPKIPNAPFDVVVFDAPSTGDSTDLLKLPQILSELTGVGQLGRDATLCAETLRDPRKFAAICVTLAEELPVTETSELVATIRDELGLPLGPLVVSKTLSPLFSEEERGELFSRKLEELEEDVRFLVRAGQSRAYREEVEQKQLARLRAFGLSCVTLPVVAPAPVGLAALEDLARFF